PDPSDHGLPKMKGKAQFSLAVPLAPLPVLEAFEDLAPQKNGAAADTVILLPADPALKEGPGARAKAAAAPSSLPPERAADAPTPAAERPPAGAADLDKYFAAWRREWQANVQNQIAAAEQRLKAGPLQQLRKIQTVLAKEEAERTTAVAAKWKAE